MVSASARKSTGTSFSAGSAQRLAAPRRRRRSRSRERRTAPRRCASRRCRRAWSAASSARRRAARSPGPARSVTRSVPLASGATGLPAWAITARRQRGRSRRSAPLSRSSPLLPGQQLAVEREGEVEQRVAAGAQLRLRLGEHLHALLEVGRRGCRAQEVGGAGADRRRLARFAPRSPAQRPQPPPPGSPRGARRSVPGGRRGAPPRLAGASASGRRRAGFASRTRLRSM